MKYLSCLLAPLLLAGCVHGDNVERLQAGMDREQVRAVMGPPEGSTYTPGKDCAYYTVLKDFWSRTPWSMSDRYYVCFTDGKVETYGRATQSAQMTAP
jgi:hypothetical protein